MKWLISQPIRNKVLVFGLIMSTLPLLLLSCYYYVQVKEEYKARILEKQELTLENYSNKIEMEMNQTFHRIQVFTALNNLEMEKGAFYELLHQSQSVEEVVTTDERGLVEKRISRYGLNVVEPNERWFTDAMWFDFQRKEKVYGKVDLNTYGQPVMKLAIPYMDNGVKKGIGVTIQLQKIIGQISSSYQNDESNLYLVDQTGRIIAHQDYSKLWKKQAEDQNEAVLGVQTKLEDPKWTLIMEQPVTSAYDSINKMFRNGIIVVVMVTIIVALISVYAGFYFTTPIVLLEKAMRQLKTGNRESILNIHRTDELGELARTFNEMSAELQQQSFRLKQEKERLDVVVNGIGAGLALVTKDYQVTWANPVLEIWLASNYLSLPCYSLMGVNKEPCYECPITCPDLHSNADMILTNKLSNGEEKIFRHRVFPLNHAIEGEGEFLIVLDDITEQKEMEEQLVQTDKLSALGLMASSFAHEVNNPLATIHVYAEDLIERIETDDEELDEEEISTYLQKIKENTVRCKKITTNLLNFSRKSKWTATDVNLYEVVQNSISLMEHQLQKKDIHLHTELMEALPMIKGDSIKLMQVLVNLINNAMDAVTECGEINIVISQKENLIVLEVTDNGIGIPKDNLSKILDPFFTTKPIGKGTGLGLSVCYGIVQQFEGQLEINSEVGKGTTVVIHLPIKEKARNE